MAIQGHPDLLVHDLPRAQRLLTLEFGDRAEFVVAAGGGLLHAKGQISLAAAVVAPGLMVLAIILFMGAVSGAHLNPAVSLAFAVACTRIRT
jgi:aquaporin Z